MNNHIDHIENYFFFLKYGYRIYKNRTHFDPDPAPFFKKKNKHLLLLTILNK